MHVCAFGCNLERCKRVLDVQNLLTLQ